MSIYPSALSARSQSLPIKTSYAAPMFSGDSTVDDSNPVRVVPNQKPAIVRHAGLITFLTGLLASAGGIGSLIAKSLLRPENSSPAAIAKYTQIISRLGKVIPGAGIPGAILLVVGGASLISKKKKVLPSNEA